MSGLSASDVVRFDGSSGLIFSLSPGSVRSAGIIALKFKTTRNSGTLLQAEGQEGRSLSLELERGELLLLLRQGTNVYRQSLRGADVFSLILIHTVGERLICRELERSNSI